MRFRVIRLLSAALLGACVNLSAASAAVDCGAPVPAFRAAYFPQIGIGADYGPHYPCYNNAGAFAPCYNFDGSPNANAISDAKNNEMQASVPLDMDQMRLAGFNTVRAYGDPAKVWIAMIAEANAKGLKVVYQVSTCKSDAATPAHVCLNVPGATFKSVLGFSIQQMRQVIAEVTPAAFQNVVKLVIVGNEDLVISPTDKKTYNTKDLMDAIATTREALVASGVRMRGSHGPGVDLSSATVVGQMTTPPGIELASAFTPGAPVIENIYGAQFASVANAAEAMAFLQKAVNKMQAQYLSAGRPAMIGETGWWTAGQDANYEASTRVGTVPDAKAYFQLLYPYLRACSVPALIFEAYDQPTKGPAGKKPNPKGALEAEQNYGVMNAFNTAKDMALLPAPAAKYRNHPETRNAALFTFILTQNISSAPPMTFGVGQTAKTTVKPFNMLVPGGATPVWPTFNLYENSPLYLYRAATDQRAQCRNTVRAVYRTPQSFRGKPVPPYSGGKWVSPGLTAPGCLAFTSTNVNWGFGAGPNALAQNVNLVQGFSRNPLQATPPSSNPGSSGP